MIRERAITPCAALAAALLLTLACAGTRPTDIGVNEGRLSACPSSPNCVSSGSGEDAEHAVAALSFRVPATQAWQAAREAVLAMPRTVIVQERQGYLHAESTSALMGYVDDLELHLVASERRIDVRSASRVGYGDGGVNRARVEALRAALVAAGVVATE